MAEAQGRTGESLEDICRDLEKALDPSSIEAPNVVVQIEGLMQKIEELAVDEKEKLKKKDATLRAGLFGIQRMIQGANHMAQGTARILLAMVGAMMAIEGILKELKALHGVK